MTQPPPNSIQPDTLAAWRAWLQSNHTRPDGIWLITYRRATGKATFTYEQAVEEALCFGWIDGHTKTCLLYTSPSPRDRTRSRMPSSA